MTRLFKRAEVSTSRRVYRLLVRRKENSYSKPKAIKLFFASKSDLDYVLSKIVVGGDEVFIKPIDVIETLDKETITHLTREAKSVFGSDVVIEPPAQTYTTRG